MVLAKLAAMQRHAASAWQREEEQRMAAGGGSAHGSPETPAIMYPRGMRGEIRAAAAAADTREEQAGGATVVANFATRMGEAGMGEVEEWVT